jgi:hypothetical protein
MKIKGLRERVPGAGCRGIGGEYPEREGLDGYKKAARLKPASTTTVHLALSAYRPLPAENCLPITADCHGSGSIRPRWPSGR